MSVFRTLKQRGFQETDKAIDVLRRYIAAKNYQCYQRLNSYLYSFLL